MTAFNARRSNAFAYDILTPETQARQAGKARPRRTESVVDAEFETIREAATQHRPANGNRGTGTPKPRFFMVLRALAARMEARLGALSVDHFSALVAAVAVAVFVLCGGLKGFFTPEAPAFPANPLIITHANLTPQDANGMRLLAVNGIVENNGNATIEVPPIRANLLAGNDLVASVVIDPPSGTLKPGQSKGFATRIVHPGGKTPELALSFEGQDVRLP